MTEWATHSDELARKVLTVLNEQCHACYVEKAFDEKTLRLIVGALYETVSGLVPFKDCADILNQVLMELPR